MSAPPVPVEDSQALLNALYARGIVCYVRGAQLYARPAGLLDAGTLQRLRACSDRLRRLAAGAAVPPDDSDAVLIGPVPLTPKPDEPEAAPKAADDEIALDAPPF